MSEAILEKLILSPGALEDLTLEGLVERSLVHLIPSDNIDDSLDKLRSENSAKAIFDLIISHLETAVPLSRETPPDFSEKDIEACFIDDIVTNYDGFDRSNLLFKKLKELLVAFPYEATMRAILHKRDQFVLKIHILLRFISEKKRARLALSQSGVDQFMFNLGSEADLLDLEKGNLSPTKVITKILENRRSDIELIPCGEGGRFRCYRLKIKARGQVGVEWDYTDLVVKVMKDLVAQQSQFGLFMQFKKEHELVLGHYGEKYVSETHFNDARNKNPAFMANSQNINSQVVFQEYVNGESILGACRDPFLATHLLNVLPGYIDLYESMADTHGKIIDCASIAKRNVLVSRGLNPKRKDNEDDLNIWIVDTNNLIQVDSVKYRKMFVDRHTGENHYLARLRQFVRDKALPENLGKDQLSS